MNNDIEENNESQSIPSDIYGHIIEGEYCKNCGWHYKLILNNGKSCPVVDVDIDMKDKLVNMTKKFNQSEDYKYLQLTRNFFYFVSISAALFSAYLSVQIEYRITPRSRQFDTTFEAVNSVISTGLDGGAAGFAILSGLALIAIAITHLRK